MQVNEQYFCEDADLDWFVRNHSYSLDLVGHEQRVTCRCRSSSVGKICLYSDKDVKTDEVRVHALTGYNKETALILIKLGLSSYIPSTFFYTTCRSFDTASE